MNEDDIEMETIDGIDEETTGSKYLIPNISRALKTLEYLTTETAGASITQISEHFSYPKNSVFRIIKTLEHYGYVEETNRKYQTTPRLLYLGYARMRHMGLIENSLDVMHALRDLVNETVMIGTLHINQVVIIDQLPSLHYIKFTTEIGKRVNLHASSPGKAILAFLPKKEQQMLLDQVTFTRYTDFTIPSKDAMLKEIKKVKELGYAVDDGEEYPECHCIGSPILDYRGYPIASLWTVGPSFRLVAAMYDTLGPIVRDHALQISRRFGFDPVKDQA
jgi:DNA-binding IclR family transcriptional regulator